MNISKKAFLIPICAVLILFALVALTACDGTRIGGGEDFVTVKTFRNGFFYLHINSGYGAKGGVLGRIDHVSTFKTYKTSVTEVRDELASVADEGVEYVVYGENIWGKADSDGYGRSVAIRLIDRNEDGTSVYALYSCAAWLNESNVYFMMPWHLVEPNSDGVERNADLSFVIRRNAAIPLSGSVEDVAEFYEFNGYSVVAEGNTLVVTDEHADKIRESEFTDRGLSVPESISFTVTVGEGTISFGS